MHKNTSETESFPLTIGRIDDGAARMRFGCRGKKDSVRDNGNSRSIFTKPLPSKQQWGDPSDRESVLAFGKYLKGKKRERERERVRDRCVRAEENDSGGADVLFRKHVSSILRVIQPCMWFIEVPSQFSMVQTTQRLSCSIMAKIHSWLDDCLRMLQACFRKKTCTKEEENLFGLEFQRRNRGTRARLSSAQTATKIW